MDPAIAQALATLIGAIATAITIIVAYYFGPNGTMRTQQRKDAEEQAEQE